MKYQKGAYFEIVLCPHNDCNSLGYWIKIEICFRGIVHVEVEDRDIPYEKHTLLSLPLRDPCAATGIMMCRSLIKRHGMAETRRRLGRTRTQAKPQSKV